MKAATFEYRRAETTAQAVAFLAAGDGAAKVCGGSQSLGPMLNLRLVQIDQLIDVRYVEAMQTFSMRGDVLRIGAGVTHARIEDGELPDVTKGLLPKVAADIAYRAVRNRGTLGGSLAHADPAADWVSTMSLLDAGIVIAGSNGERTMRATEFFQGAFTTDLALDEIVVAVDVPVLSAAARWAYCKTCRKPGEFAEAIGAVYIDPARGIARALMGSLGGMPLVVQGHDELARLLVQPAAMQALLDDAGLEDAYERQLHAVMLRRALETASI
jgi:carbon-monoxide dehydrogenase medium subunit